MTKTLSEYPSLIYGFFLGDKEGNILKESVFNPDVCPQQILTNVLKAFCTFAEDTQISKKGTIELSRSKISFIKIQDITYVLNHNLPDKMIAETLIGQLSEVFVEKSKTKFYSGDPQQVFSGASAVFNQTVEGIFDSVITFQKRKDQEKEAVSLELEFVDTSINYDEIAFLPQLIGRKVESKESTKKPSVKETKKQAETSEISQDQKLSAVTFNILNSIGGIDHLVFVEHDNETTNLFYHNGKLDESFVNKTLKICEKFLSDIIEMMNDESMEKSIDVTEVYQIIFVPLNESNFFYAIAKKNVDAVLMNPVFERIAKRIKDVVLEYKTSKE
ncbi:MAG: hypothetical protein KGD64_01135 [Candidatus Heimdallarchaeota archaeon]|nr:hypothetical protein [Candidatus Heimdallarchaeota archaeon]